MFKVDQALYQAMEWRCIGPFRGGRVLAVAGHPNELGTFYFGATGGGLWKTTDAGAMWRNISDGYFRTGAVGAIAVAESDPNVIYAGTGEACVRGNASHGDGVYKSTNGGKSWTHLGLEDSRHIARIRVHPKNPDLVYVAALGHAFGPNKLRGVFRSKDGGESWEHILFKSENAGAVDLSMDTNNPRVLYASIYQMRRYPWAIVSGGPDSGLWRSTDGGDTWSELTGSPGFPKGRKGRIGVAASPAKTDRVWALVEAEDDGGFVRSDNGGDTWERMSEDPELLSRPFYYTHVFVDPVDEETVYVLSNRNWKSTDGGKTFTRFFTPHDDNHDLWIDPKNPKRMIHGNDEGASVSFNDGVSWTRLDNQPTAQMYHVTTDTNFPYRVYGGQQDCSTISIPSQSYIGAITAADYRNVGGCECAHIAVRPDNPDIVYSGCHDNGTLHRFDLKTGDWRDIRVWPEIHAGVDAKDMKYRFQWTYPIMLSPHDPNVLYVTGNHVFRTTNEGQSWEVVSPDLTRNDVTKQVLPAETVTRDFTNVEYYCTIFAFAESPVQQGVLWAGSDDGLIHVSIDNGKAWENVTPKNLPEWTTISIIDPSHHDAGTAYVAAHRYRLDDYQPYLYKTSDYGKTWKKITSGIPDNDFSRAIREDPIKKGLLYASTETGVYVSFNDGENWQTLQLNLPAVPVHDIVVKDNDLVAATHGRSFWILDDVTPLQQIADGAVTDESYLFKPRASYRYRPFQGGSGSGGGPGTRNYSRSYGPLIISWITTKGPNGETVNEFVDSGKNPPSGAIVHYYLNETPKKGITLSFLDKEGNLIKSFVSKTEEERASGVVNELRAPADAGMNRFVWDMRYPDVTKLPSDPTTEGFAATTAGPMAPPGTYQVKLTLDGKSSAQSFEILKNPLNPSTQEDMEEQFQLLLKIRNKLSDAHEIVIKLRGVREQIDEWVHRAQGNAAGEQISKAAEEIKEKLAAVEYELTRVNVKGETGQASSEPVKLSAKLAALTKVVASSDYKPTDQAYEAVEYLAGKVDETAKRLGEALDKDVPMFVKVVEQSGISSIMVKTG